mgnify:CR=1 FL=1
MLTKKDAVAVGTAIVNGLKRELERHQPGLLPATQTPAPRTKEQEQGAFTACGVALYALDNLWYDVLPEKVKVSFGWKVDNYYEACGWHK